MAGILAEGCAASRPADVRPRRDDLRAIGSLGLTTTATGVDVRQSRESMSQKWTIGYWFLGLVGAGVGAVVQQAIETSEDERRTAEARKLLDPHFPENALADHFLNEMRRAPWVQVSRVSSSVTTPPQGQLRLDLQTLELKARDGDALRLHGVVRATLIPPGSDRVVWDRTVSVFSDRWYRLDRYLEDDGRLLLASLESLMRDMARRLAADLVFLE